MLGKLLKYELKATARYFVPLLATFGGITLLFKLFMIMIGFGNDPLRMTFSIFIVTIYLFHNIQSPFWQCRYMMNQEGNIFPPPEIIFMSFPEVYGISCCPGHTSLQ